MLGWWLMSSLAQWAGPPLHAGGGPCFPLHHELGGDGVGDSCFNVALTALVAPNSGSEVWVYSEGFLTATNVLRERSRGRSNHRD